MFEKLETMEQKYIEISERLSQPDIVNDNHLYTQLMKDFKNMTPVIEKYREYKKFRNAFHEAQELLGESGIEKDFREMAQLQYDESREAMENITQELKVLLLPKDPDDDKNVIIEIRGGAGGEEASLFANSLYRMLKDLYKSFSFSLSSRLGMTVISPLNLIFSFSST